VASVPRLLCLLAIQLAVLGAGASALAGTLRRGSLRSEALWQAIRPRTVAGAEDVLLAVVLGAALIAGAATTLGTAATLALRVAPSLHPLTVLSRLAIPAARGLVPLAAAASLTALPTSRVAAATRAEVSVVANESGSGAPVVREPATDRHAPAANVAVPRSPPRTETGAAPGTNARISTGSARDTVTHHVVVSDDHLWGIAAAHLRELGVESGDPSPSTVARYWSTVISANRATLRSGNPNLIFPGEVVVLPALDRAS
jgi:nucleoid-associated protein YgaU